MEKTEKKKERIRELVRQLNEASEAYYNGRDEIMSNFQWDWLFDELSELEKETGYVLPDSPTANIGAETVSDDLGRREPHEFPALSLAKTKDVSALRKWAGERPIWLSWKLDGLTLVLTYDEGRLSKVVTRGNGTVGNNITYLADYILGYPREIPEKGHLVVRGEATISYTDFNRINSSIENPDEQYANPRNLVSGTLNLDSDRAEEVRERCVCFNAFTLVYTDKKMVSWGERMQWLQDMGFTVVDRELTSSGELDQTIDKWTARVRGGEMDIPVDGLVIAYDDTDYAATGSVTGHHATNAGMAFKWQDTVAETVLDHVEWSCAAFAISPVAVFRPVSLEGTTVSRASLCNISEMKRLGIGADGVCTLKVVKANMIIPKVVGADAHGTHFVIPSACPVCGAPTEILTGKVTGTETLHCTNPDCNAKHIQKFTRFVSKSGMDIDGLSEKTLVRFINEGFISGFADIYGISAFRDKIIELDGFGLKSFENIETSVEKSRHRHPVNFINALCIPLIGIDAAKRLISACGTAGFFNRLESGSGFEDIDGIGPEKSNSIIQWYSSNAALLEKLLKEITLDDIAPAETVSGSCSGLTFVITGDVYTFRNRDEFKAYVEEAGGKVTGSVSKKTDFLVNNDSLSESAKNKKAKELGIPVITEAEFIERFAPDFLPEPSLFDL